MKQAQELLNKPAEPQNGNGISHNSKSPFYCYNCNAESNVVPLRHCSKCKAKHVNEEVLYCSAECQTDDWPNHKTKCGRDAPRYNALEDTGFILGNSAASAGERNLRELNIVYRLIILWAVRQAYAANRVDPEKQYLVLNFAQYPEHGTVLHSTHFESFEESISASKVLRAPLSIVKNKNPIQKAFCCTRLSGIETFVLTPLCYQEQPGTKMLSSMAKVLDPQTVYSTVEMRKLPIPRWPWFLTTLVSSGIRSPMLIDSCLVAFILCFSGNQTGVSQEPVVVPTLGRVPWVFPLTSEFITTSASQVAKIRQMAISLGVEV